MNKPNNELIKIPRYITREFIEAHPDWNFVHSVCVNPSICVGPCRICSGLPNCFGVPVRWRLCRSSGYFQDSQVNEIWPKIEKAIAAIPRANPIILFPYIGNRHSRMSIMAPVMWKMMMFELNKIATPVEYTGLR